jgi:hypothetical protein
MYVHKEPELIKKLRIVKNCFERFYVILVCLLWIVATCWDIYKLQRYWFDYALELYTTFLIFITFLFSISPKAVPSYFYKSFKIISKIKGRGTLFIIVSLLFLRDNFSFHRFSAFILLIAGVLSFILELLIPTTKEEIEKIEETYGKTDDKNNNDINIFNSSNNNQKNKEEKNVNNNIDKIEEQKVEIKSGTDMNSEEQIIKNSNNAEIPVNNQSTNPYDLPDDF